MKVMIRNLLTLIAGAFLTFAFLPASSAPVLQPSVGLNKFDLAQQYLGRAMGGNGSKDFVSAERALAKKAIEDAHRLGIHYFRVPVTGYGPSAYGRPDDLDLWISNPTQYWLVIDGMMSDLRKNGIYIIPTFVWNMTQFPSITGETVADMLHNPDSRSYKLLTKYVYEFVSRYRSSGNILFYELTNEMNLGADIDLVGMCLKKAASDLCSVKSNYTTDDMIEFTGKLSKLIKSTDPGALLSSGYSVPRSAAEHLRKSKQIPNGKMDWAQDSITDLETNLTDTYRNIDIVSVHLYSMEDNKRFGSDDPIDLLSVIKRIAEKLGKPLFVGEFGDPAIKVAGPGSYVDRMLDKIAELQIPYSAIWVWEYYQRQPNNATTDEKRPNDFNLEPGSNDRVIAHLIRTNRRLGNPLQR